MSEDSDLLLFGCQRVFFKLEKGGMGKKYDLHSCSYLNFTPLAATVVRRIGELVEMSDVFQCRNDELDMRE